jgi:hypothetical protein
MKSTTFTFGQIAAILEAGKIPCTLKQFDFENGTTDFYIEFGFNWPEQLMEDVDKAFAKAGFNVPSNVEYCGDICGGGMVAKTSIAGGKKCYFGEVNKW